jgi:hypothetical protein
MEAHTEQQYRTLDSVAAHVHTTREYGTAAVSALADAGLNLMDFIRHIADTDLPPDPEATPRHTFTALDRW